MRLQGNPLDLNSLPEEHGKHPLEESSLTTAASADITRFKKTKGAVKVYECRFCSLKFCKSQALGGHMNRHRQERETETLNRARQLVFSNDGAIGLRDPSTGEACLQFHPVYPGLPNPPPPMSQYLHPSPSSSHSLPQPRCYIGHVVSGSSQRQPPPHHGYSPDPSFTRYGAPVSHSFPVEEGRAPAAGRGNQLRSEFRTCPPQLALLGEPSAPGTALTYTS